jgi:hypothetical protein
MRWEGWPEKSMAALPKHNWADTTNRQLAGEVVQLVIKTMALRGAGILVSSLPGMRDVSFSTQNRYFVSMLQQLNSFALIEPSPKKNRIGPAAIFEIRSGGRTGKISQTLWTTLVATEENYPARAPAHEPILLKDPNYAIADHPFTGKDCAREVIWPILAEMVVKALSGCMPKRVRPAHFIPTEKQLVPWIRTARYHKEIRGFTPDTASWERKLAASALTPLGIDRQGCVSEEWVDPATWRRITRGRRIKVHVDSLPNVLRRIRKQARAHMRTVPLSRWPHSSGPTPKTASGTAGPESEWLKSRVNNEGSMMDALFEGIDTPEL